MFVKNSKILLLSGKIHCSKSFYFFLFYLSHIMCFESDELYFTLNVSFPSFFCIIFTYFKYNPQLCLFSTRYELHKHDIKRCNCIFGNTQYTFTEI